MRINTIQYNLYCLGLEPNISKCKHLILAKQRKSVSDYKILDLVHIYRVAQKKVYAFDFVQRKNYKCYVPQINVILSRKA